jgi:hypothetical protein
VQYIVLLGFSGRGGEEKKNPHEVLNPDHCHTQLYNYENKQSNREPSS